ncbi:MAG: hypothetical protein ACFHXK_02700 [bacterium]
MKTVKYVLSGAALLAILVIIVAPIGPMPGIFIGGQPTPAPTVWMDTSEVHEIKLAVPGTIPRVVIIWVIQQAGELYVVGARDSGWVKMIGEGSPVKMRLGDNTYALNASLITDGWAPVLNAYVDKYRPDYPEIVEGFPPMEEAQASIAVFRLDRT